MLRIYKGYKIQKTNNGKRWEVIGLESRIKCCEKDTLKACKKYVDDTILSRA
jgi:hypothetical protein